MIFHLDTTGSVPMDIVHGVRFNGVNMVWSDLTPFTQGYVEALWSAVIELRRDAEDRVQMNLDDPGFRHLSPETLARVRADCAAYLTSRNLAADRASEHGGTFWTWRQAGGLDTFPPLTVQLGDDGKVRFAQ